MRKNKYIKVYLCDINVLRVKSINENHDKVFETNVLEKDSKFYLSHFHVLRSLSYGGVVLLDKGEATDFLESYGDVGSSVIFVDSDEKDYLDSIIMPRKEVKSMIKREKRK